MSRVDVVVPCYKYAHYLKGCVTSILRQDGVEVRVLVIDDCSPDDTPAVAAQLVAENPERVEYRRHAFNQGHIATYNEGLLGWASGEYCLLLSADDMLLPGALRRATRFMDVRPDVVFTYGKEVRDASATGAHDDPARDVAAKQMVGPDFVEATCRRGENMVSTPTAVVRTIVQHAVGGYRKELPHAGDMEMWLRCAAHGAVGFIDQPQAFYRVHDENMSKAYYASRISDLRQQCAAFHSFFAEYGATFPEAPRLRRLAERNVAQRAFWSASYFFDEGHTAACRECLDYARELSPGICRSASWWRLAAKRAVGRDVWSLLQPIVERLRGTPARRATRV
jgi:glycosyltransferase involved in cell wall biosynthesis